MTLIRGRDVDPLMKPQMRSQHETGLRVTTWGLRLQLNEGVEGQKGGHDQVLRLQHEAESNEVPARKFKLRPLYLSRTSKEVATNHSGCDLKKH